VELILALLLVQFVGIPYSLILAAPEAARKGGFYLAVLLTWYAAPGRHRRRQTAAS
jgi:hypothetical protein